MQLTTRLHENRTKTFLQISIPSREIEAVPLALNANTGPSPIIMRSFPDGKHGERHPKAGEFDLHTSSLIDRLTQTHTTLSTVLCLEVTCFFPSAETRLLYLFFALGVFFLMLKNIWTTITLSKTPNESFKSVFNLDEANYVVTPWFDLSTFNKNSKLLFPVATIH